MMLSRGRAESVPERSSTSSCCRVGAVFVLEKPGLPRTRRLAAWTLTRGGFAGRRRGWGLLHRPGAAKHEESSWLSVRLLLLRDLRRGRETA
jgi:hypothetical protein